MRSVRSVVILNSELNQFHPDTVASEEMVINALTKEDATQRTEGRLNLNFQANLHIWGGFFESLKHAKISYENIEFKN